MSTRKSASLDGSLLARKGDAAPAVPGGAQQMNAFDEPRRRPSLLSPGTRPSTAPRIEAAFAGRLAPLTKSGRGLVALVSVALLALVLMAVEQLSPPDDHVQLANGPAGPSSVGAPVSDATPVPERDVGDAPALPSESLRVARPVLLPASATVATPDPPAAKAPVSRGEGGLVAAVVSDAPPPPVAPVRKKPVVAKAAPRKAPPAMTAGPYILQLAAFASENSAQGEAARMQKALGAVLGARKVVVVRAANADKKTIWRLRASSYPTLGTARAACENIRKLKTGCLVIRR